MSFYEVVGEQFDNKEFKGLTAIEPKLLKLKKVGVIGANLVISLCI